MISAPQWFGLDVITRYGEGGMDEYFLSPEPLGAFVALHQAKQRHRARTDYLDYCDYIDGSPGDQFNARGKADDMVKGDF